MKAMKRYPYIKNAKDNEYSMHEVRNMIDLKMKITENDVLLAVNKVYRSDRSHVKM